MIFEYINGEYDQFQTYFGGEYVQAFNSVQGEDAVVFEEQTEITSVPAEGDISRTVIEKFSDYSINSIDFFISKLKTELSYRDLPGFFDNNHLEKINITKQHPLINLLSTSLNPERNTDLRRSGILPAISVTPGNSNLDPVTMGQSLKTEIIDDTFTDVLKVYADKIRKEIINEVIISKPQIDNILLNYKKTPAGGMKLESHEWHENEEINVSVWSNSPDMDIFLSLLISSLLASIQVGLVGDNSRIKNMNYKVVKSLKNFNFGKVLFGTEFSVTFTNKYTNYMIYTEPVLSGHEFYGTFTVPGETYTNLFRTLLGTTATATTTTTATTEDTLTAVDYDIIQKFSDYAIHPIEFFISVIQSRLNSRDLPGLFNNKIEKINVTKQSPLVALMATSLSDQKGADLLRSGIVPAICVESTSSTLDAMYLGQALYMDIVDENFILDLSEFLSKTDKEIYQEALFTKNQIQSIIDRYNKAEYGAIKYQKNEWNELEELNISVWSDSPDLDIILGNLVNSILADIQSGMTGDNSSIKNMSYKITKGLTNFNFGKVLFGTEFILTFLNTYNNYAIYEETILSGHDFNGTFTTPGE